MNDFLANHVTWLEIIYLISAVLAALVIPYSNALDEKKSARSAKSAKYFLTYGHVAKGLVGAIIPVVNTIAVAIVMVNGAQEFYDALQYKQVFKERVRD